MFIARPSAGERGPSYSLWNLARLDEIMSDRNAGFCFFDDFCTLDVSSWLLTQATTGTFALVDGDGGVARVDSASTTRGQGANVQKGMSNANLGSPTVQTVAHEFITCEADAEVFFETRFKIRDVGSAGAQVAFGLSASDTSLITTNAHNVTSGLVFASVEDAEEDILFVADKATAEDTIADVGTFIDSDVTETWHRAGFHVKGLDEVFVWFDGVKYEADSIATANIPDTEMTIVFECKSGNNTVDPILDIDWVMVAKHYRIG